MLPGLDGMAVCQRLKADPRTSSIPVMMLTVMSDEGTVVKGLNIGADDYMTKPFSPDVLVARIRAVLRRTQQSDERTDSQRRPGETIAVHDLAIHLGRHEARLGGELLDLTPTEFEVLAILAGRPGWVFTRQQIIQGLYGSDAEITPRAVDVQVLGLRRKLGPGRDYIQTVRGVGYRFLE